jgi:hypothetical protein
MCKEVKLSIELSNKLKLLRASCAYSIASGPYLDLSSPQTTGTHDMENHLYKIVSPKTVHRTWLLPAMARRRSQQTANQEIPFFYLSSSISAMSISFAKKSNEF